MCLRICLVDLVCFINSFANNAWDKIANKTNKKKKFKENEKKRSRLNGNHGLSRHLVASTTRKV